MDSNIQSSTDKVVSRCRQSNVRRLLPTSDYCRALFRCLNCAQRFHYRALGSGRVGRKSRTVKWHDYYPRFSKCAVFKIALSVDGRPTVEYQISSAWCGRDLWNRRNISAFSECDPARMSRNSSRLHLTDVCHWISLSLGSTNLVQVWPAWDSQFEWRLS